MIIKKFNEMNVEIKKQFELITAFHAVYLLKHPEAKEKLDFIETPNNKYMKELVSLINPDKYPEIIKYIMNFSDCSIPVQIAIGMSDSYEIDKNKTKIDDIKKYMEYGTVDRFSKEIQKLAKDINWDTFFENHRKTYESFVNEVCVFPNNLDLNDIEEYYSVKANSYTFIPSMLINGGYGPSDNYENFVEKAIPIFMKTCIETSMKQEDNINQRKRK